MWIQEEAEIKLGVDSKCAPEEEGEKLKVKSASQVVQERLTDLSLVKPCIQFLFFIVDVFLSIVGLRFFYLFGGFPL